MRDPIDGDSSAPHWARGPWECGDWRAIQADRERAPTGGAASPVPAGSSVLDACASEASSGKWRAGGVETGKRLYCVVRLVLRHVRFRRARYCHCCIRAGFAICRPPIMSNVRLRGSDLTQIRRAEAADEEALASIRRRAILALAVPAMSREQAERWATRGAADRVARAMREHDVWVAVEGAAIGWVEVDRDRVAALYVSPSCSRRGVGSVILTFAETSIRSS